MLSTATGSLLDDEELVLTLQSSKTTSSEVKSQLIISEQTEKKIDAAREGYRPTAYRASILYFLLADLARVDPMYQFSLDAYVALFNTSLEKSARSDDLQERLKNLNNYHTEFVYRSTCRALFESHKLLFSFQICAKILQARDAHAPATHPACRKEQRVTIMLCLFPTRSLPNVPLFCRTHITHLPASSFVGRVRRR